ncbi:hypothetical protein [Pseudomonas sp. 06C 126]|uniref:hypothetical protein n=1 Tax=Pseudomonas sp. 06C 126 TaxID=1917281 RepID=UPI0008DAAB03|nr:hypothetical protein [Pseudomonas sp. 06C 126]OHW40176.1 hypothetical protein BHC62_17265 [Pseudomonas sp. 06C 126]
MTASNIERFDELTGQIFGKLYTSFPIPTHLQSRHFIADSILSKPSPQDPERVQAVKMFYATARWLATSGYISFSETRDGIEEAVLTAKGLEVLKATPSSLESGPSIGERLAATGKEGGKEIFNGLVGEALGLGARLFAPLIGLPQT